MLGSLTLIWLNRGPSEITMVVSLIARTSPQPHPITTELIKTYPEYDQNMIKNDHKLGKVSALGHFQPQYVCDLIFWPMLTSKTTPEIEYFII